MACSKAHLANHPPDDEKPKPKPPDDELRAAALSAGLPARPAAPPSPFAALENSDKLAWLFRKYPNLPQQLLDIHAETQPPPPEDASKHIPASLRHGPVKRAGWTRDKGINKGKAALRNARELPGEQGEAVREYCTLVTMLLGEADDAALAPADAPRAVLEAQHAQQDAQIIRQLMEEERGPGPR